MELDELMQRIQRWKQRLAREEAGDDEQDAEQVLNIDGNAASPDMIDPLETDESEMFEDSEQNFETPPDESDIYDEDVSTESELSAEELSAEEVDNDDDTIENDEEFPGDSNSDDHEDEEEPISVLPEDLVDLDINEEESEEEKTD